MGSGCGRKAISTLFESYKEDIKEMLKIKFAAK